LACSWAMSMESRFPGWPMTHDAWSLGDERSPYPALPLLRDRLAPGCLVVLDDAQREGERWVIERWRAEFPLDLQPTARRLAAGLVPG
jgi:hypothetical protein